MTPTTDPKPATNIFESKALTDIALIAGIAILGILFAVSVIRIWGCPLILPLDGGQYGFNAFFLSQHFDPWPLPHINLESDQSLYPFGIDHVFLHWAFEREFALWGLTTLFGSGPWLQLYFLASILFTAVAAYAILKREFGPTRAILGALALSFGNFYVIRKFPIHIPHSCVHWTTLGVLLDFVIVRRVASGTTVSARLLTARLAVLALGLGQELGYVAGFSLASFVLSLVWSGILIATRSGYSACRLRNQLRISWAASRTSISRHPRQIAILMAVALLASWLYLPMCAQIVLHADRFDFSETDLRTQHESPLRVLMPYLPGFNPGTHSGILEDRGEPWGFHFSPGLAFVLAATAGLIYGRRKTLRVATPFLVLFLACVFYKPDVLPTLKVFPWFVHAQVPGRASSVLPILLATAALSLPRFGALKKSGRAMVVLILLLFSIEVTVAYGIITDPTTRLSIHQVGCQGDDLFSAMEVIRTTPGEAVFEWPFSIAHDTGLLGSFQKTVGVLNQLAPYHGKKQVSGYFGRIHLSRLEPFIREGWPGLFSPQRIPGTWVNIRQSRDMVATEWALVTDFVEKHDFSGIILFTDLLPPATVDRFHQRFGEPSAAFALELIDGAPGNAEFIAIHH